MKKLRTYIAGPMTGITHFNFPAFDRAAERLRIAGFEPVNPADLDRSAGFDPMTLPADWDWNKLPPEVDRQDIITRDLEAIATCDAYVLLTGWEHSVGATAEKSLLDWYGATRYDLEALKPWNDAQATLRESLLVPIRTFESGATRDADHDKFDYEGFLSPLAIQAFGAYMHKHRIQPDGNLRPSDNWQKGIPRDAYMKSLWRHFLQVWLLHRGHKAHDEDGNPVDMEEALCAVIFNAQGYLHETLKKLEIPVDTAP
jgi:hypothetical protein